MPPEGPHRFPVVIQGGLFDVISPFFNNHPWFSKAMPMAKGLANLYDELNKKGYNVRLFISAQLGHGYGAYKNPDGTASHYQDCLDYFLDIEGGKKIPNYKEYKFTRPDPRYPEIRRGTIINTLDRPDFKYEPYESLLQKGLTPEEIRQQVSR